MSNLLPCPFCGGEAFIATVEHSEENRPNGYRFRGQIMCLRCQASCGTTGFDQTYEEATLKAISAWNRRAQPENEPLTETERTVARMIEDECMRESLATLCKGYGVTEADFFGFLYRITPTPGKEG